MVGASKLLRQWLLLRAIAAAGGAATIKSLVAQTGVSEKTIRRDVALLRRVGFPVEETLGEFGRKTFAIQSTELQPLNFPYDEALALFYCRRAVLPLAGTFFWESVQNAFRKIQASLGPRAAKYVERMAGRVFRTHVGGAYADKAELIDRLLIAIDESKATFIAYHSTRSTEPLSYPVEPYGLVEHRGSLYLVGHSQQHDELRHWKVDRIDAAEVTQLRFQRPADFWRNTSPGHSASITARDESASSRFRNPLMPKGVEHRAECGECAMSRASKMVVCDRFDLHVASQGAAVEH